MQGKPKGNGIILDQKNARKTCRRSLNFDLAERSMDENSASRKNETTTHWRREIGVKVKETHALNNYMSLQEDSQLPRTTTVSTTTSKSPGNFSGQATTPPEHASKVQATHDLEGLVAKQKQLLLPQHFLQQLQSRQEAFLAKQKHLREHASSVHRWCKSSNNIIIIIVGGGGRPLLERETKAVGQVLGSGDTAEAQGETTKKRAATMTEGGKKARQPCNGKEKTMREKQHNVVTVSYYIYRHRKGEMREK